MLLNGRKKNSENDGLELQELLDLQSIVNKVALTALLDPCGCIVQINQKMLSYIGSPKEKLLNTFYFSLIENNHSAQFVDAIWSQLSKGLAWKGECCHTSANQSQFWTSSIIVPLFNSFKKIRNYQFLGTDISERKLIETSLNRNQEYLRALIRLAPSGIFLANFLGDCIYVNHRWLQTTNLNLSQCLGNGWLSAVHPDDRSRVIKAWTELVENGVPFKEQYRYVGRNKKQTWVLASAIPIHETDVAERFLRIEQDLTELKKKDALIDEQKSRLAYASKLSALYEMAGGIAHEINNPLAVIKGRSEHILQHLAAETTVDTSFIKYASERIDENVNRISRIVNSINLMARIDFNNPLAVCSVSRLLSKCLNLCEDRIDLESVQVSIENDVPDPHICCLEKEVLKSINNIINNALDALDAVDQKWIKIKVSAHSDYVEISITDSGKGIQDTIKDKIFLPFFTTKESKHAPGLGLSTSRSIIEKHGGKLFLAVNSKHTRFIVRLPKYQSTNDMNQANVHQMN